MKEATPLITVMLPYYNDKMFFSESIDSVLSQSFDNFELILLNHASTDGTREIAHSYDDSRIVHIDVEVNSGAGGGLLMDHFLKKTRGKYVKFFCADDIMLQDCLQKLSAYLESHPGKDMVFADLEYVDQNGCSSGDIWSKVRPSFDFGHSEYDLFKLLINGTNPLPYPSSMVKKSILQAAYCDYIAVVMFDMYLWASMIVNGARTGFIHDIVAQYRQHDGQMCTIKKIDTILQASGYESFIYTRIFSALKEKRHIEYCCANAGILVDFDMKETSFIKYVVGRFYMNHKEQLYRYCGFLILHDLLQNQVEREKIADVFSFGICELRSIYRTKYVCKTNSCGIKGYLKTRILSKNPIELNILDLIVLIVRKGFVIIRKKIFRREGKYTA